MLGQKLVKGKKEWNGSGRFDDNEKNEGVNTRRGKKKERNESER